MLVKPRQILSSSNSPLHMLPITKNHKPELYLMWALGISVFMLLLRFLPYNKIHHLNLSNSVYIDKKRKKNLRCQVYNIYTIPDFFEEQKFCRFLWEWRTLSPPFLPLVSHQSEFVRRLGLVSEEICPAVERVTYSGIGDAGTAFFWASSLRYGTACPWKAPFLT